VPAIEILVREGRWSVVWLFAASAFTDVLDGIAAHAHMESIIGAVLTRPSTSSSTPRPSSRSRPWARFRGGSPGSCSRYGVLIVGTCYLYSSTALVVQPTAFES
jgi:hypothetical protein